MIVIVVLNLIAHSIISTHEHLASHSTSSQVLTDFNSVLSSYYRHIWEPQSAT